MGLNLDFLKFSDKKTKRGKKSGLKGKVKKEFDETFTLKNIWKNLALFCLFFGFILKHLPVISKIPLPFLGSVGGFGSLLFLVSALYLAYKHRDVVTTIFSIMKFFIISGISLVFMTLFGGIYYYFQRGKLDKAIRKSLDITGLPESVGGGSRRRERAVTGKQRGGADEKTSSSSLPPGVSTERYRQLEKEREAKRKSLKKRVDGLVSMIPVNILSELGKDYKKRLLSFVVVYILSLNYFVIYKTYSSPRKVGKLDKEENEAFWAGIRGFCFAMFICFMMSFRMLMRQKGEDIAKNMKKIAEYSVMFSLITGFSSAFTKYLVKGPLSFIFNMI